MPEKAPARLTRLRDKIKYLAECGIDYLLCVKFDKQFAAQTPEEFVSSLLVDKLGVKFLAIGDDFRFGKNRAGDFHFYNKPVFDTDLRWQIPKVIVTKDYVLAVRQYEKPYSMTI